MSITLNRASLDFLLRQVTINYLVPDGNGGFVESNIFNYSALTNAVDPSGLREVSGANNNLVGGSWDANTQTWVPGPNGSWGQADQPFLNLSVGQPGSSAPEVAYNQPGVAVFDSDPRLISNLVSTMFTTGPNANPAIALAATNSDPAAQNHDPDVGFVANAGVLGGGRYNAWFVAFGQFFDHGLDFVVRDPDPTATVSIALSPNDPLYDAVNGVTSISIRRADVANAGDAGGDGTFGTIDDVGLVNPDGSLVLNGDETNFAKAQYINNTGLLIDQSQTYGSHAGVNALIREYDANGSPTGRVVAGNTGAGPNASSGLATWADIKINALRIGVILDPDASHFTNVDVNNAPMLRVDPVGKLMYTPDSTDLYTTAQIIGYDPLNQDPNDPFVRDALGNVLRTGQDMLIDFNPGQPLDSHFITGDGRANENIGLTAVHHVFHEEHNGLVANIQASVIAEYNTILADPGPNGGAAAAAAFIAPWQSSPGAWDGEKLYQSARLITESEYNHIAIDQYVGTLYGALPEFVSYSSDINMGVSLEFSQSVFRLGHSMLTETFDVDVPDGSVAGSHKLSLLEAFVNPELYATLGPTALAQGFTTSLGNEVDEFVTPALQQSLLGQPLDLATINIARGREVGLPTWNEFRQQVYDQLIQNTNNTNGSALAPYTNWADVFDHLKNPLTGVNFIAAYGRDTGGSFDWGIDEARAAYQAGLGSLDDIRVAAQAVYDAYLDAGNLNHDAAVTFMDGTPTFNETTGQWTFEGADQGFWDIDLWIGGLAERPLFDGPLGTTFSFVILDFAQRQQDGDRFYYLFRTPMGTSLGNEIIENQFGNLVSEHTGLTHTNGEIFIWSSATFELDGIDTDGAGPDGGLTSVDANGDINDYFNAASHTITDVDGAPMQASGGHLVIAGNEGHDFIIAGLGDDTVYGDAGNDTIQGSQGNDHLFGGDGDDLITDDENDDFISGGAGNDRIFAGGGALDTVFGDEGDDELHGGDGIDEVLGGSGDDMIYGDGDTDVLFGDDGNDYVDGGDSVDEIQGQSGNDWLRGGVGDDHLMGGDGNDLLEGGVGPTANDGDRLLGQGVLDFALAILPDLGTDVASYEDIDIAINANLQTSNENGTGGLLDTYAGVEGLVGSRFGDNLIGADATTITSNGPNNFLVGGAGADVLTGLGGNDTLVGDSVFVTNDLTPVFQPGAVGYTLAANWRGTGDDRPDFGVNGGLGHILGDNGIDSLADIAVFRGDFADYDMTFNLGLGTVTIADLRDVTLATFDGIDTLFGIEWAQFADQSVSLLPTPPALDLHTADTGNYLETFGTTSYSGTDGGLPTPWATSWTESDDDGSATSDNGQIRINGGELQFDNGNTAAASNGASIQRIANLSGASTATLSFDYDESGFDAADSETVLVQFSASGLVADFVTVQTINSASGNGSSSIPLTGPFGANSTVRFVVSSVNGNTDIVGIDNINIAYTTPVNDASNNYATTFTEDGPAAAISSGPGITDDSATMAWAKIVLTNAQAGDVLTENGIGGDGISGSLDTSVAGQITLTLSGTDSIAAYQAAIGRVTFSNTSQSPDATPRTIDVTVNDGLWTSNLATTTVTVTAVDDPMVANNDRVVTNITDGSTFTIPEWVFLANDTDPDAAPDITAVTESSSGFTAVLTAGGVAITDTDGSGNSFTYTGTSADTASVDVVRDAVGTISGNDSFGTPDILIGNAASSSFDGGVGDDFVFAGDGDDTIVWNSNLIFSDGRDFVDGQGNTAAGDRFVINGNFFTETFNIYTAAAAAIAGLTGLNVSTEIVITRNGAIIAELDNVEEITINTLDVTANNGNGGLDTIPSGDTINVFGNFAPPNTSLNFSTITVNGGLGNDTVDISGLTSDHRIVFNSGGGNDNVVGTLRLQDVVNDDDWLVGTGRADTMFGGTGADTIFGKAGDDRLRGGMDNDRISGGAGRDVVNGGDGDDRMSGGAGGDIFVFRSGFGRDIVTDFDANPAGGQDLLVLRDMGITEGNFAQHVRILNAGADTLVIVDGQHINLTGVADHHSITVDDFRFG